MTQCLFTYQHLCTQQCVIYHGVVPLVACKIFIPMPETICTDYVAGNSHTHTLHLNYYHMQWQYKFVIQFVQEYKNLYAKFEAYLRRNEGLIRNSVLLIPENIL